MFGSTKNRSVNGSLKNISFLPFYNLKNLFFRHKKAFVKQKGYSEVKDTSWNHLDKKVILCHREAPLFLRVYLLVLFQASRRLQLQFTPCEALPSV